MLSRDLSAKSCCHCAKEFVPQFSTTQIACSLRCAKSHAVNERKAKEKKEREQIKQRKEAIQTLPELKKAAQTAFNAWVRARDAGQPCISCGAPPPDLSQLHAGRDAGHYRSVGSAPHVRYHEDNVHSQCVACNQWGAGRAVDYRIGLVARIGLARVEALEADQSTKKYTREELRAIRDTYKAKTKELLRDRE